jgi:hypothetical protein
VPWSRDKIKRMVLGFQTGKSLRLGSVGKVCSKYRRLARKRLGRVKLDSSIKCPHGMVNHHECWIHFLHEN